MSRTYSIVQKLVSEKHGNNFPKVLNQRSVVIGLSCNAILNNECFGCAECKRGRSLEILTRNIVKTLKNKIFLKQSLLKLFSLPVRIRFKRVLLKILSVRDPKRIQKLILWKQKLGKIILKGNPVT